MSKISPSCALNVAMHRQVSTPAFPPNIELPPILAPANLQIIISLSSPPDAKRPVLLHRTQFTQAGENNNSLLDKLTINEKYKKKNANNYRKCNSLRISNQWSQVFSLSILLTLKSQTLHSSTNYCTFFYFFLYYRTKTTVQKIQMEKIREKGSKYKSCKIKMSRITK